VSKFFKMLAKDYMRSLIITLISTVIAVPLVCVLIFIPLAIAARAEDSTTAMWVAIASAVIFLLILFGGGAAFLLIVFFRRARRYNAIFEPLGLKGKMFLLNGRQYLGTAKGRQVDVRFYRGPTLDIRVSTTTQARLSIANSDTVSLPLARMFGREPLDLTDPGLSGLTIFAHDEVWALSLLANPEVKALLRQMILSESAFLMRQVHLEPGKLRLYLYRNKGLFKFNVSPNEARQWLNGLLALARIAETLPDSQDLA
jgi:hypothetical protein